MTPTIQELIDQLNLAKAQRDAAIALCRVLIQDTWQDDPGPEESNRRLKDIEEMDGTKPRFCVQASACGNWWHVIDRNSGIMIEYTSKLADPCGEYAMEIADQHNNDPFELSA